jgi:hypothetical protein
LEQRIGKPRLGRRLEKPRRRGGGLPSRDCIDRVPHVVPGGVGPFSRSRRVTTAGGDRSRAPPRLWRARPPVHPAGASPPRRSRRRRPGGGASTPAPAVRRPRSVLCPMRA